MTTTSTEYPILNRHGHLVPVKKTRCSSQKNCSREDAFQSPAVFSPPRYFLLFPLGHFEPIAAVKARNFLRSRKEMTQAPSVFLGDNGQGDYKMAVTCEEELSLCLIHRVKHEDEEQKETAKIKFVQNWVEGAGIA